MPSRHNFRYPTRRSPPRPSKGSRFIVRLSTAAAAEADIDDTHAPRDAVTASACRVQVAEDNPDAAEMMRLMLSFKGHDVRVAADGVEAVALAERFVPHIACVDIGMPRMDGYEAARAIRERLGFRVVLVAVTGWGQDDDKRRSREAGFDHHVTKPPEPETLERLIASCTRQ